MRSSQFVCIGTSGPEILRYEVGESLLKLGGNAPLGHCLWVKGGARQFFKPQPDIKSREEILKKSPDLSIDCNGKLQYVFNNKKVHAIAIRFLCNASNPCFDKSANETKIVQFPMIFWAGLIIEYIWFTYIARVYVKHLSSVPYWWGRSCLWRQPLWQCFQLSHSVSSRPANWKGWYIFSLQINRADMWAEHSVDSTNKSQKTDSFFEFNQIYTRLDLHKAFVAWERKRIHVKAFCVPRNSCIPLTGSRFSASVTRQLFKTSRNVFVNNLNTSRRIY